MAAILKRSDCGDDDDHPNEESQAKRLRRLTPINEVD